MIRENVLSHLLHQDDASNPNIVLLKKYLFCIHQGWFRINGAAPDKDYTLGDYLLDDERIVFDYTRLSDQSRESFTKWFLMPHAQDARKAFLSGVATNDYRGYTAEVSFSWWGRITNLIYYKKKSYHWPLAPLELSLDYQLTGMEICQGKNGLLIGLNQFATEHPGSKYQALDDKQENPLRNVKRLVLTDDLVERLINTDLHAQDFDEMICKPHPYAIQVNYLAQRFQEMREHRQTQRFIAKLPWYVRLWQWIKSKFETPNNDYEMDEFRTIETDYQPIINHENATVLQRPCTGEILIKEKRPELNSFVWCGGGAKFFAHVGAYKAFEDAGIKVSKFAGSSAGGIMGILCYLGYSADEILNFIKDFRQENLVHYNIDRSGISDTKALKAALDFMITQKVNQIISRFKIDESHEGRVFLSKSVFPDKKITFASLRALKTQYPECELGEELVLTATNIKERVTRYFSYSISPDTEVSRVGEMSASLPIVFKPTLFQGQLYNDGGNLNNLPTEPFRDDHSTLLTSEHDNCLSMIAFQFDNGHERGILDKLVDRVYRENFFWNWVYGFLTGVRDPVSGWERDRIKLLQHSNQVVILPVNGVSAIQFEVDSTMQATLVKNGYEAANNYLASRYDKEEGRPAVNREYMYANFTSIEEALYFTCFRNRQDWFELMAVKAIEQGMSEEKVDQLRQYHFQKNESCISIDEEASNSGPTFFHTDLSSYVENQLVKTNMQVFEALYPVFLKFPCSLIKNATDLKIYKYARHSFSLHNPLTSLAALKKIVGEVHVLFAILMNMIAVVHLDNSSKLYQKSRQLIALLENNELLHDPVFFGQWSLLPRQAERIFNAMEHGRISHVRKICLALKNNEEPMQTFIKTSEAKKETIEENDDAEKAYESNCLSFSG